MNNLNNQQIFNAHKKMCIEYFDKNLLFYDFEAEILNKEFKLISSHMVEKQVKFEETYLFFFKKTILRKRYREVHHFLFSIISNNDYELKIQYWTINQEFNFKLIDKNRGSSIQMWIPRKVTDGSYYVIQLINKIFDEYEQSIS